MIARVLVVGRGGQLARSLAERAPGHGVDTLFAGRPELDLADADSIRAAVAASGADLIVNAAAYTAVDQAESDAATAEQTNAIGPGLLAEAARDCSARLIHVSTDYVFDGTSPEPYGERAPVSPLGVYGRTKLAGERAALAAAPDVAVVRTAWVYSPFGRNFVRTMLDLARSRDELRVVDDQLGNPTSALDLADGLLTMTRAWLDGRGTGLGGTYHLAGTGSTSWAGLAAEVFRISEGLGGPTARVVPIQTSEYPTAAARPANSRLDCRAFAADFDFSMPDWRSSLNIVVERLLGQAAEPR